MKKLILVFLIFVLPNMLFADVLGKRAWTWDTTAILPLHQGTPVTEEETNLIAKLKQGETSEVIGACLTKLKAGKGTVRLAWLLAQCARLRKSLINELSIVQKASEEHPGDLALMYAHYKLLAMAFHDKAVPMEFEQFKRRSNELRSQLLNLGGQELPVVVSAAFDGITDAIRSRVVIERYIPKASEGTVWQLFRARAYSRGAIPLEGGQPIPLTKAPKISGLPYPDVEKVLAICKAILAKEKANPLANFYIAKAYALTGKGGAAKKALRLALADGLPYPARMSAEAYITSGDPMAFYRQDIHE